MCDELLLEQLKSLIENERNVIANLANASALLTFLWKRLTGLASIWQKVRSLSSAPFRESLPASASPLERGSAALRRRPDTVQRIDNVHLFAGISPVTALPMQRL